MIASSSLTRCTIALVMLAMLAYGVSSGGLASALLGLTLAGTGWWLANGTNPWAAPKWVIGTLLVLVIARWLWTLGSRPATSITPFLSFLASIMVVKCWERSGPRDFAQILSIAAFILIGSALGSNSFGTGLLIALAFPVMVHAAMVLQVDAARAKAEQLRGSATNLGSLPKTGTARLSMSLALLGAALATGVFVIVPRTQGSAGLAALGMASTRMSGFRDRVELGQAGLINLSQAIVMEVDVVSGEGVPSIAGPEGELYLRGAVLDRYNHADGSWTREALSGDDVSRFVTLSTQGPLALTKSANERDDIELTIRDRDRVGERRPVFSPWRPISIAHGSPETSKIEADASTGTAIFESAVPAAYTIRCTSDPGGVADGPRHFVPAADYETIRTFAEDILRSAKLASDPEQRPVPEDSRAVKAMESALREKFRYTRELLAPPAGQPAVDWFLLTAKEGHCEYFAGALAAMCRSVGINARVVTGYVSGEFDPERRMYTVRQAGAHAWVEAEVGPGRWRSFDATPAEEVSRLAGAEDGVFIQVERWLAGLETAWNSRIVNFGHQTSTTGIGSAAFSRAALLWLRRVEEAVGRIGIVPVITWTLIGLGVASFVFIAAGLLLKVVVRRVRGRETMGKAVRGEATTLYVRTLKAWEKLGTPKPAWRGAMDHASTLSGDEKSLAQGVLRVCYESFFGGGATPESLREAALKVDALESAARAARLPGRA